MEFPLLFTVPMDGIERHKLVPLPVSFSIPYYRTFDGFQALIEKDWLSFGHKFSERCGHINPDVSSSGIESSSNLSKETSPIFTQFIDCVWQMMQQFPFDFEFNELLLLTLHDHVYSCQFGTFIGNSEKERHTLNLRNTTYSLWAFLDSKKDSFVNPSVLHQTQL